MIGKLTASGAEGVGNAVSDVVGTLWGSKQQRDSAAHDEQLAFAAEFAVRLPATLA